MAKSQSALAAGQSSNRPEWVDFVEDRFGARMFADVWPRWQRWMAEPQHEGGLGSCPSDDELLRVLRWARQQKGVEKTGLTVDRLMSFVRWYRKEHGRRAGTVKPGDDLETDLRAAMATARHPAARRDVWCDGLPRQPANEYERQSLSAGIPLMRVPDVPMRGRLRAWAAAKWPDFDEFDRETREAQGAELREWLARLEDKMILDGDER